MATTTQPGPAICLQLKSGETASSYTPWLRVKQHTDGTVQLAGAGDYGIGSIGGDYNYLRGDASKIPVNLDRMAGTQKAIAAAAITAGSTIYGAAGGKVSSTPAGDPIGVVCSDSSAAADGSSVEFVPMHRRADSLRMLASGSAYSNATAETVLGSLTIPANRIKVGTRIRFRFLVNVTSGNSSNTLTLKVRLGGVAGTLIATGSAVDVTDGGADVGIVEGEIIFTSVGATGALRACGSQALGPPASATFKPWMVTVAAALTGDTTADNALVITGTWSAASASNSCVCEQGYADVIG